MQVLFCTQVHIFCLIVRFILLAGSVETVETDDYGETALLQVDLQLHREDIALYGETEAIAIRARGTCVNDTTSIWAANRLQLAKPLAWLHLPKGGSSLGNTLMHLPGMCPGLPCDAIMSEETAGKNVTGLDQLGGFLQLYNVTDDTVCPSGFSKWGDHIGIGNRSQYSEQFKGHTIVMLRQPEQRLISDYNHDYHSWKGSDYEPPKDIVEYANVTAGCGVKLFTRSGKACGDPVPPTSFEVLLARTRLRSAAFVGIMENWELSVCLLHAKFGGACKDFEFQNTRPGKFHTSHDYNTTALQGFTDPYDGPLYADAVEIFQRELKTYGVTDESCDACIRGFHASWFLPLE